MNKFVRHNSILFIILTWMFIIALFVDGSNVTDIFSNTMTLHSDDDYASISLESINPNISRHQSNDGTFSTNPHASKKNSGKIPSTTPRIVYDEDSPSVVGTTFESDLESSILCDLHWIDYAVDLSSDPLYLRYCKLLI